jgi:hypothetical protein
MPPVVGVDFDNTLVSYDEVMHKEALALELIAPDTSKDKTTIRDTIRRLPDGEHKWTRLQARVYGKAMGDAILIDGVQRFFNCCKKSGLAAYIVSHKSTFAAADEDRTNLRDAALQWMQKNKFFDEDGLGFSRDQVSFKSTRREKIQRIKDLGCTHFIDDLEEVFLDEFFPENVQKILYDPHKQHSRIKGLTVFHNWYDIEHYFFKNSQ